MIVTAQCPNCHQSVTFPGYHACRTGIGHVSTVSGPGFNTRDRMHVEERGRGGVRIDPDGPITPVDEQARCLVAFDRRNAAHMKERTEK